MQKIPVVTVKLRVGALLRFFFKTQLPVILLALMLLPCPSTAAEDDGLDVKTVKATGYAPISGDNAAIARDVALDDALRKAVEQAVGMLVAAETIVENFEVISDNIYTKTRGYVKEYTVTGEKDTGKMYRLTVSAIVAMGDIKDDIDALGLLYARVEKPRVLFMIAEQNIGQKYYTFWWWGKSEYKGEDVNMSAAETALKGLFLDRGFNVVDISGTTGSLDISKAFRVADLTNKGARRIGTKLNAEVVIKGKALAKEGPRAGGSVVGSYLADVTAQAIRVDDGVVLASARGHGVSRHISDVTGGTEAIDRAATELSEKLIEQIIAKWSGPKNILVRVSGIDDYRTVARVKNAIKKRIKGVKAVYQRSFESGTLVIELDTHSSTQSIADSITRLRGIDIEVTGTSRNTINAKYGAEPRQP